MKKRGVGISSIMFGFGYGEGFPDHSIAMMKVKTDGRVELKTAAADVGQGVLTIVTQIAAEVLAIPVQRIDLIHGDTAVTKNSGSTSATRQTFFTGNAVKNAAENLKGKIFDLAAEELKLPYAEIYLEQGHVIAHDTEKPKISLVELAEIAAQRGEVLESEGTFFPMTTPPDPETGQGERIYVAYTFVTTIAEVEVDLDTGQVEIIRLVVAPDVGQAINPQGIEGQIEGGSAQGIGMALMEEIHFDQHGTLLNPNFSTYLMPTALDVPRMETVLVEDEEPLGPFGAKGVGEPATIGTAPAITNAIYNACGVRIKELPATPEKILRELKKRGITEKIAGN